MYLPIPNYNNPTTTNGNTNSSIYNGNGTNISDRSTLSGDLFTSMKSREYSNSQTSTSPAISPMPTISHNLHIPPIGLPAQALQPKPHNSHHFLPDHVHNIQQQSQFPPQPQQLVQHQIHHQSHRHQIQPYYGTEQPHHQQFFGHSNNQQIQVIHDSKKKRGRPKKLILDPITNQYIDSTHPNFKYLNKMAKSSSAPSKPRMSLVPVQSEIDGDITKLYDKPTYLRTLEDDAVQQLLQKKDKRGRPRKFPIEQTGLTIKGIRVNGTAKQRKKKNSELHSDSQRVAKRERGRPKKTTSTSSLEPHSTSSSLEASSIQDTSPQNLK